MGDLGLSRASIRNAWQLRDRASEQEKFFIDFSYDRMLTGNLEKAHQTCELWAQTYPRDKQPHSFLSSSSKRLAKFEEGTEEFRFLSVFDWTRHKGWDLLLRGFLEAFPTDADVVLVLKVWSTMGYTPEQIKQQAAEVDGADD